MRREDARDDDEEVEEDAAAEVPFEEEDLMTGDLNGRDAEVLVFDLCCLDEGDEEFAKELSEFRRRVACVEMGVDDSLDEDEVPDWDLDF